MAGGLQIPTSATSLQVFHRLEAHAHGACDARRTHAHVNKVLDCTCLCVRYACVVLAFFSAPIVGVLLVRPKHQMGGVDAGGGIALVHNNHTFGYGAARERIGDAVRELLRRCTPGAYKSVAHVVFVSVPELAFMRLPLREFFIKAVDKCFHSLAMGKHLAAVKAYGGYHR